jgi:hypothetical protein
MCFEERVMLGTLPVADPVDGSARVESGTSLRLCQGRTSKLSFGALVPPAGKAKRQVSIMGFGYV